MNDIVERAMRHDKEAFCALIRDCELGMYKAARAILRDEEDVADAMQEAILTAWEKIGTLRQPKFFRTWLVRILINKCYDILNGSRRQEPIGEIIERGAPDNSYDSVEWRELIGSLEEKYRIVIVLYYSEGYKVREIAEMLDISTGTVKDRLAAARRLYAKKLAG